MSTSNAKENWSVPILEHFSSVFHKETIHFWQVASSSQWIFGGIL